MICNSKLVRVEINILVNFKILGYNADQEKEYIQSVIKADFAEARTKMFSVI